MTEIWHRGFRVSVFVRRIRDEWEVATTIYAPEDLIDEFGDEVTMDLSHLPTDRIDQVRADSFEQAKKAINEFVWRRTVTPLPAH
jgi:hypothetical protein